MKDHDLTPEAAVEALKSLHAEATSALKNALDSYFKSRVVPTPDERATFRYPELVVTYEAHGLQPNIARAYAKFTGPGVYATNIT